ncbi:CHAT domain-containing protein [Bradyrhizobium mercantei]|uniref:CHAT domain-containing protein n=1 Tax=Bradyrhizobium mercantei TaxID=1904807 RepID=UPI0009F89FF2|nr:CHAT domain-containing protein [Bradyrhizobium mercantei]
MGKRLSRRHVLGAALSAACARQPLRAALAAGAAANADDDYLISAGLALSRSDEQLADGFAAIKARQFKTGQEKITAAQLTAVDGIISGKMFLAQLSISDVFLRRVAEPILHWLHSRIIETQYMLNALEPSLARLGTDLAFSAAADVWGLEFVYSMDLRRSLRTRPEVLRKLLALQAIAEIDAAIQASAQPATLKQQLAGALRDLFARLGIPSAGRDMPFENLSQQIRAAELQVGEVRNRDVYRHLEPDRVTRSASSVAAHMPYDCLVLAVHCGRQTCYLFALHPSGAVRFVLIGDKWDLKAEAETAQERLSSTDLPPGAALRSLSGRLLSPVADWLAKASALWFIPDGPLTYFPVSALLLPGTDEPVISRMSVTILPASLAAFSARIPTPEPARQSGPPLVVGIGQFKSQPPLRFAELEAREVAGLVHAKPLLAERATPAALSKAMATAGMIHVASHATIEWKAPMLSALVLRDGQGNDAFLRAFDILGMDLNASLVVLSDCQTGFIRDGSDGVLAESNQDYDTTDGLGIIRAFLVAGASSVIATHWRVDDETTAAFMRTFYQHVTKLSSIGGPVEALRLTQDLYRRQGKPARQWAPFFLAARGYDG